MITIKDHKKTCNGACDEVVYEEAGHEYTAVLSPNSGIISQDEGQFNIIDELTRKQLIELIK